MKVHPSFVQDLRSLFVTAGAVDYDVYTATLKHQSRRKRARRLSAKSCSSSGLTGKGHTITSICTYTLFPFCVSHSLAKHNLSSSGIKSSCSCSPNDADYAEAKLPKVSDENVEPFADAGSTFEEELDCFASGNPISESVPELVYLLDEEDGFRIQIVKLGKRSRRIEASILIKATLSTIWEVLTDYERLADFIPGLAVTRVLEKRDKYARLFQIGQQDLALGFKFNAKAILDCYEKDLEILSYGQRRDIEFKMVEGDFKTFEGRWSIVQFGTEMPKADQALDIVEGQEFHTTLFYEVKLEPKLWLPVHLVEGRISKEIKTNLSCICQKAENKLSSSSS